MLEIIKQSEVNEAIDEAFYEFGVGKLPNSKIERMIALNGVDKCLTYIGDLPIGKQIELTNEAAIEIGKRYTDDKLRAKSKDLKDFRFEVVH